MRRLATYARAALAVAAFAGASRAGAQALGPQRQFLAIEPYYEYTRFDLGDDGAGNSFGTVNLNGYGGRLWINGAPFHFPLNSSIALFMTYAPSKTAEISGFPLKTASVLHYGAEIDQFFVRRPFGGVIDPFLTVGAGAYRTKDTEGGAGSTETHFALSPGGGIRIPLPNRFELRGDVRDLIIFGVKDVNDKTVYRNNLVVQGGLGITF